MNICFISFTIYKEKIPKYFYFVREFDLLGEYF